MAGIFTMYSRWVPSTSIVRLPLAGVSALPQPGLGITGRIGTGARLPVPALGAGGAPLPAAAPVPLAPEDLPAAPTPARGTGAGAVMPALLLALLPLMAATPAVGATASEPALGLASV